MKKQIRLLVKDPNFKQVLKEWSLHIKLGGDCALFATMFLEWMRDPVESELRMNLAMFVHFMKTMEWPEMMAVMGPKLDPAVAVIFRSRKARPFYEGFRALVVQQIHEYWEQFLTASKDKGDGPREWSPRTGKCSCKKHRKGHVSST